VRGAVGVRREPREGGVVDEGYADRQRAVDRQQRGRRDVVAAASATPAAIPTEVSSADDTTTGSPMSSAIRRQARTPPSGWTFSTATSAASRSRTR
jgi:hypothetical protein